LQCETEPHVKHSKIEIGVGDMKNIIDYATEKNDTLGTSQFKPVDSMGLEMLA
jgi:hypothetical protein